MRSLLVVVALALAVGPASRAEEVLLSEDFDDGTAESFEVISGDWEVVGGVYHCRIDGIGASAVSQAAPTPAPSWSDYRLDMDVRTDGSINHVVRYRVQDDSNYYQFNVRADPFGDALIEKVVDGAHVVLSQVAFPNPPGTWRRLSVEVIGRTMLGMCDGVVVAAAIDDSAVPYLQGPIALEAFGGGVVGWQDLYVDDVEVVSRAGPVTVEPTSWAATKDRFRPKGVAHRP